MVVLSSTARLDVALFSCRSLRRSQRLYRARTGKNGWVATRVAGNQTGRFWAGKGLFSAVPRRGPRGWNNPAIVSSRVDSDDRTLPSKIDSLRKIDVRAEEFTLPIWCPTN
jgi:hypothetical protein